LLPLYEIVEIPQVLLNLEEERLFNPIKIYIQIITVIPNC